MDEDDEEEEEEGEQDQDEVWEDASGNKWWKRKVII